MNTLKTAKEAVQDAYETIMHLLQESEQIDDLSIDAPDKRNANILKAFRMIDEIDTMFNGDDETNPVIK
jgi:hypothetical protein